MIHLLKGCIGTGILAMPNAFSHSGWVTGILLTAVFAVLCCYGILVLVSVSTGPECNRMRIALNGFFITGSLSIYAVPTKRSAPNDLSIGDEGGTHNWSEMFVLFDPSGYVSCHYFALEYPIPNQTSTRHRPIAQPLCRLLSHSLPAGHLRHLCDLYRLQLQTGGRVLSRRDNRRTRLLHDLVHSLHTVVVHPGLAESGSVLDGGQHHRDARPGHHLLFCAAGFSARQQCG